MSAARSSLDATLGALADPTRRRVVELLRERPRRASALAEALSVSPPALSRHLRVLRRRGLVQEHHPPDDARVRIYQLRPEPFADLAAWTETIEGLWREQLSAFAEQVEHDEAGRPATTKRQPNLAADGDGSGTP